jgi:uncharacterized protein
MTDSNNTENNSSDIRQQIIDAIAHLEHVLPAQAPIKDFVHHNTLHGYQHLDFPEALHTAYELTGAYGYESEENFRKYFSSGRITPDDLSFVLQQQSELDCNININDNITTQDVYLITLLHPLKSLTVCQLKWHLEELGAHRLFQTDVNDEARNKLLAAAKNHGQKNEEESINALWLACLQSMNLENILLHPEDLVDLDPETAESMMSNLANKEGGSSSDVSLLHRQVHKATKNYLGQLLRTVGRDNTISGFLKALTGINILDDIRPALQQHIANFLDQGLSAWHNIDREKGFYAAWRNSAAKDLSWIFEQIPEWCDNLHELPEDPLDTITLELRRLGIAESHWVSYLQRLALELPGWSGMFLWRHLKPGYENQTQQISMLDYLAVRLILERLFAQRLCREQWQLEANLDILRWYFRRRRSEFFVRYVMFNQHLPEYLLTLAQRQVQCSLLETESYQPWKHLADMIMTWRNTPLYHDHYEETCSVYDHGWKLFRIAQHLGLCSEDVKTLSTDQIASIFLCLDELTKEKRSFIWLQAYEHHYREQVFNAISKNVNRGRWKNSTQRPQAQIIFCMDDREESIRRHLEEHNPAIETLGAAGFFGVAINWQGLDDDSISSLCPIVVDPVHLLHEEADIDQKQQHIKRKIRRNHRLNIKNIFHQETRRSLFTPALVFVSAPFALLALIFRSFFPRISGTLAEKSRDSYDSPVYTHIAINTQDEKPDATPDNNQVGFTDKEQADRIEGFLCNAGLNKTLAPFVVMMGHGSMSSNNPHLSAYDCGACSGRHGGPNARAFAAMANRETIREILKSRGFNIPDDTWFIGAEHNTCDEKIEWYDENLIPVNKQAAYKQFKDDVLFATKKSAHERCRRLASAPQKPSLKKALKHIISRAYDFSQARPELGHATNASAIIGRRSISQGAFFDRRVFLISYDPTQDDEEGHILERILAAVGPVGAGINLEYYFSTVNNEAYGCGSKITHNITGLFAVMDGTNGDLRTGLPKQMIEIHEAMRLQVVVESTIEILTKIYSRQPELQELIGKGWLLLSAKDPDSDIISVFNPAKGFETWKGHKTDLPVVDNSTDWYDGKHDAITPVLIKQPETSHEVQDA